MSSFGEDMQRCLHGDMCKMVYSCPAEYSPRVPFPYWNANQTNNIHLQPIKDIWNGAILFMLNSKLSGLLSQSFKPHLKCFLSWLDPKIFPFVSITILTTSLCYTLPGKTEVIYHTVVPLWNPSVSDRTMDSAMFSCGAFTELILFSGNINHSFFFELE